MGNFLGWKVYLHLQVPLKCIKKNIGWIGESIALGVDGTKQG